MTELDVTESDAAQMPMVRHAADVCWVPVRSKEALAWRGETDRRLFRSVLVEVLESLLHRLTLVETLFGGLGCSKLSDRSITVGDDL